MTETILHEKPCLPSGLLQQILAVLHMVYLFIYLFILNYKMKKYKLFKLYQ